jgi:hypothetical protein
MFISMRFRIGEITGISALVGIQLAVRNSFQESPLNYIDFVIWWLGNLPNRRNPTGGEEQLARLHLYLDWHHY